MPSFKGERDVAQPGSAHVWGACGRKFESCRPDLKKSSSEMSCFFYWTYYLKAALCPQCRPMCPHSNPVVPVYSKEAVSNHAFETASFEAYDHLNCIDERRPFYMQQYLTTVK